MIRRVQTGLVLLAALGLSGVVACGNADPDPTGASSAEEPLNGQPGTPKRPNPHLGELAKTIAVATPQSPQSPAFQLGQCSMAQVAAIVQALNTNGTSTAVLALQLSQDTDVRTFAQTMITDDTNIANQLSAWLTASGTTPATGDISLMLLAGGQVQRATLDSSRQFDRDYTADSVIDLSTAWGFLNTLVVPGSGTTGSSPAPAGSTAAFADIIASASSLASQHLSMAYTLETKVVGTCGTPPATASSSM